jgi:hypothetical protein
MPQCWGVVARSLPGPRPKRLGLFGTARGRRGLAGSRAILRVEHRGEMDYLTGNSKGVGDHR